MSETKVKKVKVEKSYDKDILVLKDELAVLQATVHGLSEDLRRLYTKVNKNDIITIKNTGGEPINISPADVLTIMDRGNRVIVKLKNGDAFATYEDAEFLRMAFFDGI